MQCVNLSRQQIFMFRNLGIQGVNLVNSVGSVG
jgi:hypothetical protein